MTELYFSSFIDAGMSPKCAALCPNNTQIYPSASFMRGSGSIVPALTLAARLTQNNGETLALFLWIVITSLDGYKTNVIYRH